MGRPPYAVAALPPLNVELATKCRPCSSRHSSLSLTQPLPPGDPTARSVRQLQCDRNPPFHDSSRIGCAFAPGNMDAATRVTEFTAGAVAYRTSRSIEPIMD